MRKVTISDVAKRAGVSTATVSHVINRSRVVSEKTSEMVMAAVRELDYTPDSLAQSFRTGKKMMIGFIVPDISNRFYATIIERIEEIVSQEGYHLIIANTKENARREVEHIRYLSNGMVDGLVIASTLSTLQELQAVVPRDMPALFVDRTFPDMSWDSAVISNYQSIMKGVVFLHQKGHTNIGYIAGIPHISSTVERLQGYRDAMDRLNLPVDEKLIQFGDSMENSAYLCTASLLEQGCTALVVSNGVMSIDTVNYCNKKNLIIGKDLDLVCFNEYPAIMHAKNAGYIYQPVDELGNNAGNQILSRIKNKKAPIKEVVLAGTFLEEALSAFPQ